jgi:hypothetical protein
MDNQNNMRWNVDKESLKSVKACKILQKFQIAQGQMRLRTSNHELYGLVAKNKSIHEFFGGRRSKQHKYFSEGSTQYILRKTLDETIQRVPDGELDTQYDKESKEHIFTRYIFENKVIDSEFEGFDMMSNLTNTFKMSWIYAFAPVRTSFEKDFDDDVRIGYNLENWADVFVNPDCKDIRRPEVVYHRQYLTKEDVESLIDCESGSVLDSTYNEDTIHYVLDHDMFTSRFAESEKMADRLKGATSIESLTLITEYRRGADEFVTFVPGLEAEFRRVPNYDPRKGIPWNFLVLETDPDFPLGVSQVEFLLADQQFNDLFQTSAYKNLLLAMEPPIMVSGWETNPSSYKYEPRKIWNMGNNPNNKVEPVKIDNAILSGWANTRESIAASMLRNLNVADGTIASDSHVTSYSKTAPGVQQQQEDRSITINKYQKRVETFFAQWAVQALRMYINAMHGEHVLTVDEETRRRLFDIGEDSCIDGNKITIDFSDLSGDMLEFKVRTGSLVQRKEDQELEKLTTMIQPIIQNLNGWSDENRGVIENDILLPVTRRMIELSDTDLATMLSDSLSTQIAKNMMAGMQQQIDGQQGQIDQLQGQMAATQQALPPESQEQLAQAPMAQASGMPAPTPLEAMPEGAPAPMEGGEASPSLPALPEEEMPGQQVESFDDLLTV